MILSLYESMDAYMMNVREAREIKLRFWYGYGCMMTIDVKDS